MNKKCEMILNKMELDGKIKISNYQFPNPLPRTRVLKDMLEDMVDEKFYISNEKVEKLLGNIKGGKLGKYPTQEYQSSNSLSSRENRCFGWKNQETNTLFSRDYKDPQVVTVPDNFNINPSGKGINGNVCNSDCIGTLTTNKGEGPKIVQPCLTPDRIEKRQNGRRFKEDGEDMFTLTSQDRHGVMIKQATTDGEIFCENGGVFNMSQPNSKTRRGRVIEDGHVCGTLTTQEEMGVVQIGR